MNDGRTEKGLRFEFRLDRFGELKYLILNGKMCDGKAMERHHEGKIDVLSAIILIYKGFYWCSHFDSCAMDVMNFL